MKEKDIKEEEMYCPKCSHCGFIGCCGITEFLEKHVKGKTGCSNEDMVLKDLIMIVNEHLPKEMQQEFLEECSKCKSKQCSGWHRIDLNK